MSKLSLKPSKGEVFDLLSKILTEWENYLCLDGVTFEDWEDVKEFVDRAVEEEKERGGDDE